MPYAAMSRRQFAGFRSGIFRPELDQELYVRFTEAWALDDHVQPLFPVPSCVFFARDEDAAGPLPSTVRRASGDLPRRNATAPEAGHHLVWRDAPWPAIGDDRVAASPYQTRFRNGATLFSPSPLFGRTGSTRSPRRPPFGTVGREPPQRPRKAPLEAP